MSALAPTVQAWFTEHLITQRQASPRTVAAYRDTLRMLLAFAQARTGKAPSQLDVADVDAALIGAFLTYLEQERHNSARTRNARLAAIRSLYRYAALRHPEHAQLIQRVLAIPGKRHDRQRRQLPPARGGRCAAGRAGPEHLDRKARSCLAGARRPDRPAGERADRPRLR